MAETNTRSIAENVVRNFTSNPDDSIRYNNELLIDAIDEALRRISNRTCSDCETTLNDGSGYCPTCDNFTMPSDFYLRWVRRTEMEKAIRNEREQCAKIADFIAQKNQDALDLAVGLPGTGMTQNALLLQRDTAKEIAAAIRRNEGSNSSDKK
jgi:uncharacterized Zn finger protein (UPF0148 family)